MIGIDARSNLRAACQGFTDKECNLFPSIRHPLLSKRFAGEGLRMRRVIANILDKKARGVRKTFALLAMHRSGHSFLIIAFVVWALLLMDLHARGDVVASAGFHSAVSSSL